MILDRLIPAVPVPQAEPRRSSRHDRAFPLTLGRRPAEVPARARARRRRRCSARST